MCPQTDLTRGLWEAKNRSRDGHRLSLADSPSAQCSCWEAEGRAGVRSHVCGITPKSDPSSDRALVPVQTLTPRARLKFSRPTEHSLALNPTITSGNAREFLTLLIGRALGKWRTRGEKTEPHLTAKADSCRGTPSLTGYKTWPPESH